MSKLPKLKIREYSWNQNTSDEEVIYAFEQAEYRLPWNPRQGVSVVVEGQWVSSYEELVQLAAQDDYKDRGVLKVDLIPILDGG